MTKKDIFSARLDRLKTEARAPKAPQRRLRPVVPQLEDDGFGPRKMILPVLSLSLLAAGAFSFANVLASDTGGAFELEAAIAMNMSDEDRAALGTDPQIEQELKKRSFADPGLARAILSN